MALNFNPFEKDLKPTQTPTTKKQRLRAFDDPTPSNRAVTDNKQSVSKPLAQALANREQSVSKPSPKPLAETVSKIIEKTEPLAEPLAGREQTVSPSVSKPLAENQLDILVGKERVLLEFIFERCRVLGTLETDPVTTEELRQFLGVSALRLRNIIYRLQHKKILSVLSFTNGRSNWRKFGLEKAIFQRLILDQTTSKALANREQSVSKPLAQALAEPLAESSSSSSYLNNKETTTTGGDQEPLFDPGRVQLAPQWLAVDPEPLASIGFSQTHLIQIVSQGKLSPELVQDSINHFAFDLRANGKGRDLKGPPINYFMGILRKGFPYAAPENYLSPQDEAMKRFHESKRAVAERAQAAEKAVYEAELEEWANGLPGEEKSPPWGSQRLKRGIAERAKLSMHFKKVVWPEIRKKIIARSEHPSPAVETGA